MGDPPGYGELNGSPVKSYILKHREEHPLAFEIAVEKRPEHEFYDLKKHPWQMNNLADAPEYAEQIEALRDRMEGVMEKTFDPRLTDAFDFYPWNPEKRE